MLLTEQDARTKVCWQPRNATNKCIASDCAMWRWFPDGEPVRIGYCGLAGWPMTENDLALHQVMGVAAQTEMTAKKRGK